MKNVNPFETVIVTITDELGFSFRENVFLTDLPRVVRSLVKTCGECPLSSFDVEFGVDPLPNRDFFRG
jgi:hypothetical protein